ncbi:hypothetical protein N7454_010116 [Penicillium verhagenii]|nr:hypothetical protein N7454_010116 [Penicillium verhagenii]
MPGVPSNKACERCKKRHLKCDETRPHCQRCTSAGVECPGYVQTRKFIDQGATVRRRYAPYHSGRGETDTSRTSDIQNQPDAQGDQTSVIAGEDGQITFQMEEARPKSQTNQIAEGSINSSISPNVEMDPSPGHGNSYNTNSISTDHQRLDCSETPSQRSEKEEFQDIFSDLMTDTEHEIAFLIRHYADVISPWIDLSDTGKFFSVYVPIRAIDCSSLKFAIASLAAKQLGRVKGAKSSTGNGMFTTPATTEAYPNAAQVEWFLKAANYYYMAASDLSNSCSGGYTAVSSSAVLESPIKTVGRWLNSLATKELAEEGFNDGSLLRKAEDMLATVTLLTLYRLLDTPCEEMTK